MCPGIYVEVGRQIQQLVLLFYFVSERLSLFSFRLDPEIPVFSHLQFHLPRAGLGSQLFTLYFQLLRGLLGFELSVLTCKAIWSTAPSLKPSLSYLQALIFTNLCLCHTVPGTLPTFSQKPKVICMLPESTTFLPMEESLLATCRGQNLVLLRAGDSPPLFHNEPSLL